MVIRWWWRQARIRLRAGYAAAGAATLLFASTALAGGGKPATKLINVADTRELAGGFTKWVGDVYNTNLWLFGLIVVVMMAGLGLVLGLTFDRLIGLLGIDLGKLDHHE